MWTRGTVDVDGTSIHYYRLGKGRQVLVLLHGLTDDGLCWTRTAQALEADFDIVMPDARGHGRSDPISGEFDVPRLAADVAGLLDGLGMRDALAFGHSMGAITAVQFAANRPDLVHGLVLEDPPLDVSTESVGQRRDEMRADVAPWRGLAEAERHARAAARHPTWHRTETDAWADAKAVVDLEVLDHLGLFDGFDWPDAMSRLVQPGLLITGEPERGALVGDATAARALRMWRSGRRLHVNATGHCVHRDRWDETMAPIRAFLTSV